MPLPRHQCGQAVAETETEAIEPESQAALKPGSHLQLILSLVSFALEIGGNMMYTQNPRLG